MLGVDHRLDILALACSAGRRERHESAHEIERVLRRLRHLVLELPGGVIRKSEKRGTLRAQLREPGDDGARVVRIPMLGAVPGVLENLAPRRALLERAEHRLLRRILQGYEVSLYVPRLRRQGRCGELRLAQARQRLGRRRRVSPRGVRGQQLLDERIGERRLLGIHLLEPLLVGRRQVRSGMHELIVGDLDQALLLGIEAARLALGIDRRRCAQRVWSSDKWRPGARRASAPARSSLPAGTDWCSRP